MTFAMLSALTLGQTGYTDRPVSNHELRNEKRGRIVDAATGAGIPDTKVIAMWNGSLQNAAGSSGGCALQRIVTTDANGDFVIPDVSKDLDISMRGDSAPLTPFTNRRVDFKWALIVFKPGYVRQGDMDLLKNPDPHAIRFAWDSAPPDVKSTWGTVWLKPIALEKTILNPRNVIIYYSSILHATSCSRKEIEQPELSEIAREMSRLARPMPCVMQAEERISPYLLGVFTRIVHDKPFFDRMTQIEGTWKWGDKELAAGTLCRALNSEDKL